VSSENPQDALRRSPSDYLHTISYEKQASFSKHLYVSRELCSCAVEDVCRHFTQVAANAPMIFTIEIRRHIIEFLAVNELSFPVTLAHRGKVVVVENCVLR